MDIYLLKKLVMEIMVESAIEKVVMFQEVGLALLLGRLTNAPGILVNALSPLFLLPAQKKQHYAKIKNEE